MFVNFLDCPWLVILWLTQKYSNVRQIFHPITKKLFSTLCVKWKTMLKPGDQGMMNKSYFNQGIIYCTRTEEIKVISYQLSVEFGWFWNWCAFRQRQIRTSLPSQRENYALYGCIKNFVQSGINERTRGEAGDAWNWNSNALKVNLPTWTSFFFL